MKVLYFIQFPYSTTEFLKSFHKKKPLKREAFFVKNFYIPKVTTNASSSAVPESDS